MSYSVRMLSLLAACTMVGSCREGDKPAEALADLSLLYDLCVAAPKITLSAPAANGSREAEFRAVISNPGTAEAHGSVSLFMWVTGTVNGATIQPTPVSPVVVTPTATTYAANSVTAYTSDPMIRIRHDPHAIYAINIYKTIPGQPNWDSGNPCYHYAAQRVIPG